MNSSNRDILVRPFSDWYPWCKAHSMYIKQDELVYLLVGKGPSSGIVTAASTLSQYHSFSNNFGGEIGKGLTIVVDCRDDDSVGGHITGALHIPDGEWDSHCNRLFEEIDEAVKRARKKATEQGNANQIVVNVVFHCMESLRRGPRCARRTYLHLQSHFTALPHSSFLTTDGTASSISNPASQTHPLVRIQLRVLEGGADRWIRRFYSITQLVSEFDDRYWGFLPSSEDEEEAEEEGVEVGQERSALQAPPSIATTATATATATAAAAAAKQSGSISLPTHILYQRPADQEPLPPWM